MLVLVLFRICLCYIPWWTQFSVCQRKFKLFAKRLLRKLVLPKSAVPHPSQSQQRQSAAKSCFTLPEPWAMTDLTLMGECCVEHFGPILLVDSNSKKGAPLLQSELSPHPPHFQPMGKLKSSSEAKPTSSILYLQLWPQSFLCLTRAQH